MATKRTIAELMAFFAPGQPARSITPDRVQDAIFTLQSSFGRISLSGTPVATQVAGENEWVKIAGTTVLGAGANGYSMPVNGRLTCTCPITSLTVISGTVNVSSAPNRIFEVCAAKNGQVDTTSIARIRIASGGDAQSASINMDFIKSQNDYIELFIRPIGHTSNPTVLNFYMAAKTYPG